ncbi:UDP-N-acetylglucosamine 2-epimerase (non-hydrolyzing) [Rhodomicrobium udaipurense]|uniref:UDP-N-acetylglucosamine 2-epimerase (non-hydrolyzing) n=2 Tax=Rhodomicrobium udaipurense TaxID=1202716 RepID=A0A8I1GI66_9HYPH|nr:UDP-N-acetylglucosamine 2-epimerase (non-hydrolyzing) [Rhodomicrobium udaipurense]MBJ7543682.1 UDP-N-acetylglucosamine 2-epimerase (non-hydrolyzing) [Rhodomicrobium udaipurense]
MRILLAFGTRPEIIKLAPVYRALRSRQIDVDVLWTGQHTDLAAGLIDFFGIDIAFNHSGIVAEAGLAAKVGIMTKRIESVIRASHYDWIVVQGDTGTALAAATAGFLNAVPVAHVEAGLRTGDMQSPWPEEFNRRVISLCTTLHFAPTPGARANLLAEDIRAEAVRMVGNTVVDALQFARARVANGYTPINPALASLPDNRKIVLATLHRRENIGDHMDEVLRALRDLAHDGDKLIVLPVHLNPEVRASVLALLGDTANVVLTGPLQYPDFVHLLTRAWVVVSDSGGIQEEAPAFGLPVLITRDTTERPEVVEAGFGQLVGWNYDAIVSGVRALTAGDAPQRIDAPNPFGDGNSAGKIAAALTDSRATQSTIRAAPAELRAS